MIAPRLDPAFITTPIAHRGLHDRSAGVIENSRAAIRAAVEAGYGVEIDLQLSADGEAMVFHDDELLRLTGERGPLRERTAEELARIELEGGAEGVPTLAEAMDIVRGRVPLLIELKDQSRELSDIDGRLERRVQRLVSAYDGPVAVMSFNPKSVALLRQLLPDVACGRVTPATGESHWSDVPEERRAGLLDLSGLSELGCSFISHGRSDLDDPAVAAFKAEGRDILTWTIRSAEQEAEARRVADNVTFEGYRA